MYRASNLFAFLPTVSASYAIPVSQASGLPSASFRFHLAVDTLAVRLIVPHAGPIADLHRQVIRPPPREPEQRQSRRYAPCLAHKRSTKGLRPLEPQGKEVKIQGISVRATRNPSKLIRTRNASLKRNAERRSHGLLYQEPPRSTRRTQSPPVTQALPSGGAPS